MSNLYTALGVSPRKKRSQPEEDSDDSILTPKRIRRAPPTPPSTVKRRPAKEEAKPLPARLSRLNNIQTTLQHALSHALATCALSPKSDTGIIPDVLNHHSLAKYAGLTTTFDVDDLKRLCWLWEWDGNSISSTSKGKAPVLDEEDNPFLDAPAPSTSTPKEWTRGGMGFIVSSTTHFSRSAGARIPAYGIGIEVEIDIDKDMAGGMAAVARWTAGSEARKREFRRKLDKWVDLHSDGDLHAILPMADLPEIAPPPKVASSLTRLFASSSPKSLSASSILAAPSSPSRTPMKSLRKSPTKQSTLTPMKPFAIPFPVTPASRAAAAAKNSISFPQTPSSRSEVSSIFSPRTPRSSLSTPASSLPSTPVHQKGASAITAPQTPTTSRRQALYERIRQKSLTTSPTKSMKAVDASGSKLSKDQMLKLSQDEMRRRCLLGRLGGVAESVWMLFSAPAGASSTPSSRKRRALPTSEIAGAIVKSSPVPISDSEAQESINLLTDLCPFFLKPLNIAGEEWLEMPAPAVDVEEKKQPPPSSGNRKIEDSAEEVLTRSPKRVRREGGGLREVRERIRKELEQD